MMQEKSNVVKKWAENMLNYADMAIDELDNCGYASGQTASVYIGSIKGCCEAIIAAMEGVVDESD